MEQNNRWYPLAKMIAAIILEEIREQMKHASALKMEKEFLTVKELSRVTPYTPVAIYRMVERRGIPFIRKGRKIVFDRQAIIAWMRKDVI